MTPEERALQRFAREKQRNKGASLFDLEEADDDLPLTHMGRALDLENSAALKDDFDMDGLSDASDDVDRPLKRTRALDGDEDDGTDAEDDDTDDQPARKKTKAEVMKEVIAKSKLHKYERQKAKEDDDDLREELDKGLSEMLDLLRGHKPKPKPQEETAGGEPSINPDRLAMLNGKAREDADKEYDQRLRQMAMDKRAAPTERTKTDEEKAAEEAQRLKDMEESRLRRMQGEVSEDEDDAKTRKPDVAAPVAADDDEVERDDAAEFGLSFPQPLAKEGQLLDEEDDFMLEDDLVASGSDIDLSDESGESDSDSDADPEDARDEEEEDEFVRGILGDKARDKPKPEPVAAPRGGLAYTYPCPRSHAELLDVFKDVPVRETPTIVQRIRALYHPSLSAENKDKLADFSVALVDHISYLGTAEPRSLTVVETLIRHIHSLSRTYPEKIATAFRNHLLAFQKRGTPTAGDLIILTAIGSIYPTSDHFHQVVTPAITIMARWLELTPPSSATLVTGAFIAALCVKYQSLSKRYVPEAVRFTTKVLQVRPQFEGSQLQPHVDNLLAMADLWREKSAFCEIFQPAALISLQSLKGQKKAAQRLSIMLQQAKLRRRPLELHHHRPQPLRTSIPKFEDAFNPDKHYDPDRERAEASKLRAEYKRERKGAVRELRKDANFIAREQLREKKEKDAEYERKYRRLVAEIQGEEGHEAKVYEREKRMRQGKR